MLTLEPTNVDALLLNFREKLAAALQIPGRYLREPEARTETELRHLELWNLRIRYPLYRRMGRALAKVQMRAMRMVLKRIRGPRKSRGWRRHVRRMKAAR